MFNIVFGKAINIGREIKVIKPRQIVWNTIVVYKINISILTLAAPCMSRED